MINDHLNIETFTEDKYLNNKETHIFSKKISMIKDDQLNEKVPLSEKEYLNKFEVCCELSINKIDKDKVSKMKEFILNIEDKNNVEDFFKIINK